MDINRYITLISVVNVLTLLTVLYLAYKQVKKEGYEDQNQSEKSTFKTVAIFVGIIIAIIFFGPYTSQILSL